MLDDKEAIQHAEGHSRHGKEIHSGDDLAMILQKGPPLLRRVSAPDDAARIPGHSSLRERCQPWLRVRLFGSAAQNHAGRSRLRCGYPGHLGDERHCTDFTMRISEFGKCEVRLQLGEEFALAARLYAEAGVQLTSGHPHSAINGCAPPVEQAHERAESASGARRVGRLRRSAYRRAAE
jgi:hypothetical protein